MFIWGGSKKTRTLTSLVLRFSGGNQFKCKKVTIKGMISAYLFNSLKCMNKKGHLSSSDVGPLRATYRWQFICLQVSGDLENIVPLLVSKNSSRVPLDP